MQIKVMRQILEWNEDVSNKVRNLLREKNVYMINVMGSQEQEKQHLLLI